MPENIYLKAENLKTVLPEDIVCEVMKYCSYQSMHYSKAIVWNNLPKERNLIPSLYHCYIDFLYQGRKYY